MAINGRMGGVFAGASLGVLMLASGAQAACLSVGAGQTISNTARLTASDACPSGAPVEITGDGATFTNAGHLGFYGGLLIGGLIGGATPSGEISYNDVTINNTGEMSYSFPGSGMRFGAETGTISGIAVNNSFGVIGSFDTTDWGDGRPISLESGVDGAVVTNSGVIETHGGNLGSGAVSVSGSAKNVTINNLAGATLMNTGDTAAISLSNYADDPGYVSNVAINNAGRIISNFISDGAGSLAAISVLSKVPNPVDPNQNRDLLGSPLPITGVTITNTGLIHGNGGKAIDNSANTAAITIANNAGGVIYGDILFGSGGGLLTLAAGSTLNVSELVVGSGVTVKATGGTINGNVHVDGGVFDPIVTINGDLTVDTGVVLLRSGDEIDISGDLSVGPDAVIELVLDAVSGPIDLGAFFHVAGTSDIDAWLFDALNNPNGIRVFTADGSSVGKGVEVTFTDSAGQHFAAEETLLAAAVPAPASLALLVPGLAGLAALRRRKRVSRLRAAARPDRRSA